MLALDEYADYLEERAQDNHDVDLEAEDNGQVNGNNLAHISVGSPADSVKMRQLQLSGDPAFGSFHRRVNERLSLIHNREIRLPDSQEVIINNSLLQHLSLI